MTKKPIVVEVTKATDDWPKGSELGFATEADARKTLGDGFKILRHTDTSEYEGAAKASDEAAEPEASKT